MLRATRSMHPVSVCSSIFDQVQCQCQGSAASGDHHSSCTGPCVCSQQALWTQHTQQRSEQRSSRRRRDLCQRLRGGARRPSPPRAAAFRHVYPPATQLWVLRLPTRLLLPHTAMRCCSTRRRHRPGSASGVMQSAAPAALQCSAPAPMPTARHAADLHIVEH